TGSTTTYTVNTAFFNALGITSAQEYGSETAGTPHGTIAMDFTGPVSPTKTGTFFETQFEFGNDYDGVTQQGLVNWKQPAQGGSFTISQGYTVQTGPNSYTMYENWSLPFGAANDNGGTQVAYSHFQLIVVMNTDYQGGTATYDNIRTTNAFSIWSGTGTGANNFSNASFWNQTARYAPAGSASNPYTTGGNLVAGNKIVFSGGTHTSGSYTYQVGNTDPGIPNGTPTPQAVTNDLAAGASYEGIVFEDSQNNGGAPSSFNNLRR